MAEAAPEPPKTEEPKVPPGPPEPLAPLDDASGSRADPEGAARLRRLVVRRRLTMTTAWCPTRRLRRVPGRRQRRSLAASAARGRGWARSLVRRVQSLTSCSPPGQVDFKPLVQLEEVKVTSGEEEEEVVFKMCAAAHAVGERGGAGGVRASCGAAPPHC